MASQQLAYAIKAVDEATATLKSIQKEMGNLDAAGDKAAKGGVSGFGGSLKSMGDIAGGIVGAQMLTKIPGMLNGIADSAAALELQQRKATTVFGDQIPVVQEWANANAAAMGLTNREVTNLAAGLADLLVPMGMSRKQATEMATETLGLAGALSEWSGGQTSAAEAADILTSAYLGETDGLKALGIAISAADVEARLALKGQQDLEGAARSQAEALAIQEMVFEKSTDAQAAYADGADSAARKSAEMGAKINEAKEALSIGLGPAIADVTVLGANALIPMLNGVALAAGAIPGSTAGIAVGFLAIAAAAPKAAEIGGNVVEMLQGINEKGLSSAQKLTGISVGIGAVLVASDLLTQKFTGHSLMELIMGGTGERDYIAELNEMADAIVAAGERLGTPVTRLEAKYQVLNTEMERTLGHLESQRDKWGANGTMIGIVEADYGRLETRLRDVYEAQVDAGLSAAEMILFYESLPAPMQATYAAVADLEAKTSEASDAAWDAHEAFLNGAGSIGAVAEKALSAEDALKKLNGQFDLMTKAWVEQNPAYQALQFSIATLDEAIGDLENSGAELTETQQKSLDTMKAQRDVLSGQAGDIELNAGAMEKYRGVMSGLMGELGSGKDAWATFRGAMDLAGISQENQITYTQDLAAAYGELNSGNLSGAISGFLNLKDTLDPATWAIIAEAVGPKFIKTVTDGVASPEQAAIIDEAFGTGAKKAVDKFDETLVAEAPAAVTDFTSTVTAEVLAQTPTINTSFSGLGASAAEGFAAGIAASIDIVSKSVLSVVNQAVAVASGPQGLDINTPSKKFIVLGLSSGEGLAVGMKMSEPMVAAAAMGMVGAGVDGATDATFGLPIWGLSGGGNNRPNVGGGAAGGITAPGIAPAVAAGPLPLVDVSTNKDGTVFWDPNTGTFVNGTTNMPGTSATWNPATGVLGTDAVLANDGLSVYQGSDGKWRDVVTDELATNADGTWKSDKYRLDALAWQANQTMYGQHYNPGLHTGGEHGIALGLTAGSTMGVTGAYASGYLGFMMEDYKRYLMRPNEVGQGALSDRFYNYGQDMSDSNFGVKTYGPVGPAPFWADPYHPGAMTGGGTRYSVGGLRSGEYAYANRRTGDEDQYKGLGEEGYAAAMGGGPGGRGDTIIVINAVDSKSVAQLASEHPDVILAATDSYRKDQY